MKIFQLLLVVTVIPHNSPVELPLANANDINISLGDIQVNQSISDITRGLVQAYGNELSADYFFNFVSNLVLRFSTQFGTVVTNNICAAITAENGIKANPEDIPDVEDISIQLRTACNIKEYPLKQLPNIINDPDFDVNKRVVIASGWLTNANKSDDMLDGLGKAFNCRGDTNFLGIDVGRYIQTLYSWSLLNTTRIGEILAIALVDLTKTLPVENFHLMGHSLGAQIVGEAARQYNRLTGEKIPRVTGFDPAGSCINYDQRLITITASDASYVDIIHTNPSLVGQAIPTGDVDFFVGSGFSVKNSSLDSTCSQHHPFRYYVESVYPGNEYNFPAKRCDSLLHLSQGRCVGPEVPMGYAPPMYLEGLFMVDIDSKKSFDRNASSSYISPNSECGACPN
ncbi:vitellogenin-1-like [Ceratitis capitata]|uniref:vitellogenin-1-like n=1 Tax=Ceratitis capitata TaxID=7213 RepID=UPI00032A1282|nr:vitellogenin-1-like [Ceratitis capitata]